MDSPSVPEARPASTEPQWQSLYVKLVSTPGLDRRLAGQMRGLHFRARVEVEGQGFQWLSLGCSICAPGRYAAAQGSTEAVKSFRGSVAGAVAQATSFPCAAGRQGATAGNSRFETREAARWDRRPVVLSARIASWISRIPVSSDRTAGVHLLRHHLGQPLTHSHFKVCMCGFLP